MELARSAASVAHQAVQADLSEDCEGASILYRKATVLLEQAAEEASKQLGGVLALADLAKQWLTKARAYWVRADLISGQEDIDNLFAILDADGDGSIAFSEFRDGFGYLEERLGQAINQQRNPASVATATASTSSAEPVHTSAHQRFTRATDEWGVLDVARWLQEDVGVGQVADVFVQGRIDGLLLAALDEEDLRELGVASGIHRKKILLAFAHLSDRGGGAQMGAAFAGAFAGGVSGSSSGSDSDTG